MTMALNFSKNVKVRKVRSRSQGWAAYSIITYNSEEENDSDEDDPEERKLIKKISRHKKKKRKVIKKNSSPKKKKRKVIKKNSSPKKKKREMVENVSSSLSKKQTVKAGLAWTRNCITHCRYCHYNLYSQFFKRHLELTHRLPASLATQHSKILSRKFFANNLETTHSKINNFQSKSNTVGDQDTKAGPGPGSSLESNSYYEDALETENQNCEECSNCSQGRKSDCDTGELKHSLTTSFTTQQSKIMTGIFFTPTFETTQHIANNLQSKRNTVGDQDTKAETDTESSSESNSDYEDALDSENQNWEEYSNCSEGRKSNCDTEDSENQNWEEYSNCSEGRKSDCDTEDSENQNWEECSNCSEGRKSDCDTEDVHCTNKRCEQKTNSKEVETQNNFKECNVVNGFCGSSTDSIEKNVPKAIKDVHCTNQTCPPKTDSKEMKTQGIKGTKNHEYKNSSLGIETDYNKKEKTVIECTNTGCKPKMDSNQVETQNNSKGTQFMYSLKWNSQNNVTDVCANNGCELKTDSEIVKTDSEIVKTDSKIVKTDSKILKTKNNIKNVQFANYEYGSKIYSEEEKSQNNIKEQKYIMKWNKNHSPQHTSGPPKTMQINKLTKVLNWNNGKRKPGGDSTAQYDCFNYSNKKKLKVINSLVEGVHTSLFVARKDYVQSNSFHDRNDSSRLPDYGTDFVSIKKDTRLKGEQLLKRGHINKELIETKAKLKLLFGSKTSGQCVQKFNFESTNVKNALDKINSTFSYEALSRNKDRMYSGSFSGEKTPSSHCGISSPSHTKKFANELQNKLVCPYVFVPYKEPSIGRKMGSGLMLHHKRCDKLRDAFDSENFIEKDMNTSSTQTQQHSSTSDTLISMCNNDITTEPSVVILDEDAAVTHTEGKSASHFDEKSSHSHTERESTECSSPLIKKVPELKSPSLTLNNFVMNGISPPIFSHTDSSNIPINVSQQKKCSTVSLVNGLVKIPLNSLSKRFNEIGRTMNHSLKRNSTDGLFCIDLDRSGKKERNFFNNEYDEDRRIEKNLSNENR